MRTALTAVVIIPTYNEVENIAKTIDSVFKNTLDSQDKLLVLVVDDTSPDGTAEVVQKLATKNKQIHLLSNQQKSGLGKAYLKGMKYAFTTLKADVVFEFDADGSHDATKIPVFIEQIRQGNDMVLGSRYRKGGSIPANWGAHRKFLSLFGNLFISVVLTHFAIRDWTTGFRAITKKVYESVAPEMKGHRFSGYTFQIGFLHKAVRKQFRIAEVPFHFVDRTHGHSKLGMEYIKNTLLYILKVRYQEISQLRAFKFAVVGFIGFGVNTVGLLFVFGRMQVLGDAALWLRQYIPFEFINIAFMANLLAAECAIISNFIWNNVYTFQERRMTNPLQILYKFPQFNISSFGTVLIASFIVGVGTSLTGITTLSKFFWLIIATAVGMVINYIVYSTIIWRKKPSK